MRITKNCENCEKEFSRNVAKSRVERTKFCSQTCHGEHTAKLRWDWDGTPFNAKEYKRRWDKKNQDKIEASRIKWWDKNGSEWYKEYMRTDKYKLGKFEARLKRRYNMTLDTYLEMYAAQEGKCAICGIKKLPGTVLDASINEKMVIDHNATTKIVRGLLCRLCNVGIGSLKHNFNTLNKAAKYLYIGDDYHRGNF